MCTFKSYSQYVFTTVHVQWEPTAENQCVHYLDFIATF